MYRNKFGPSLKNSNPPNPSKQIVHNLVPNNTNTNNTNNTNTNNNHINNYAEHELDSFQPLLPADPIELVNQQVPSTYHAFKLYNIDNNNASNTIETRQNFTPVGTKRVKQRVHSTYHAFKLYNINKNIQHNIQHNTVPTHSLSQVVIGTSPQNDINVLPDYVEDIKKKEVKFQLPNEAFKTPDDISQHPFKFCSNLKKQVMSNLGNSSGASGSSKLTDESVKKPSDAFKTPDDISQHPFKFCSNLKKQVMSNVGNSSGVSGASKLQDESVKNTGSVHINMFKICGNLKRQVLNNLGK
jgi:hypothetical protein